MMRTICPKIYCYLPDHRCILVGTGPSVGSNFIDTKGCK